MSATTRRTTGAIPMQTTPLRAKRDEQLAARGFKQAPTSQPDDSSSGGGSQEIAGTEARPREGALTVITSSRHGNSNEAASLAPDRLHPDEHLAASSTRQTSGATSRQSSSSFSPWLLLPGSDSEAAHTSANWSRQPARTGYKSQTAGALHTDNSTLAGAHRTESIKRGRRRAAQSIEDDQFVASDGRRLSPEHSSRQRQQQRRLEQLSQFDIELEPMIEFLLDRQSALEADEKVCQLIESGVYAIFGPIDGRSIHHVQSICDNLEIPYFELRPFIGGGGGADLVAAADPSGLAGAASAPARPLEVPWPIPLVGTTDKPDYNKQQPATDLEADKFVVAEDDSEQLEEAVAERVAISGRHQQHPNGGGGGPAKAAPSSELPLELANKTNSRQRQALINDGIADASLPLIAQPMQSSTSSNNNNNNKLEALTLNLYPPAHLLNSAYIDLIHALNWTSFAIVYEDSASMIKLQNILKESSPGNSWTNKWRVRLFRHDPDGYLNYEHHTTRSSHQQNKYDRQNNVFNHDIKGGDYNGRTSSRVNAATGAGNNNKNGASASQTLVAPSRSRATDLKQNSSARMSFLTSEPDEGEHLRLARDLSPQSSGGTTTNTIRGGGGTYRDVFWRVKMSGEHNILLDIKTENLHLALKQALQVGCMTEEFSYLITSLDLHTLDLEDFKYSRTKITGFSLTQVARKSHLQAAHRNLATEFDEEYLENLGIYPAQQTQTASEPANANQRARGNSRMRASTSSGNNNKIDNARQSTNSAWAARDRHQATSFDWLSEAETNDQARREQLQSSPASLGLLPTVDRNNEQKLFDFFIEQQELSLSRIRLATSSGILHDSLILYMLGLKELDPSGDLFRDYTKPVQCSLESRPWLHGSSLVNYMKQLTFTGLTGFVSFNQRGLRNDFKLDVLGMAPNIRLVKIGEWHSKYASEERNLPAASDATTQQVPIIRGAEETSTLVEEPKADAFDGSGSGKSSSSAKQASWSSDLLERQATTNYEELSSQYESKLRHYEQMLARGENFQVPYQKGVSPNGALRVNEILFERLYREPSDEVDTLVVTAKLSQPYFMLRETPNKLDGNDQFEGYAVDLIHELSKLVNFKYKWREVADKKYGSKELLPNGSIVWNGMIGEIVRGTADLAIVDLTITAQREEAVDFTLPFMNTGISILFKKPTTKVTTLFSFLSPFSSDVWAYVLAAYCGISAILFLVGHLSPYEWADPHPCGHLNIDGSQTMLKNQFTLLNSFWFTIGSLMQQGSDLTPRSMSTRTIAGIWYFFTLIMISSYTANLAAFLTVEKVVYPIENVRDLSNQQEIKYGCVESGSTCLFFHDSQIDTYKKIDETMRLHRTYVRSNDEGQKRVGEGKFAFFMESTTIEYIIERNCNLTQIGGLLDSKGYGIALAKKSRHKRPYRTLLNEGILHLQETGMLHVLKNRWWKEKRGGGTCTDDGKGGGVTELSLANVGGVFVVLLGGLGISFLVAIAEFIWRARRGGSSRDRMCEEMMNDLKFALACKSSTKPIAAREQVASGRGRRSGSESALDFRHQEAATRRSRSTRSTDTGGQQHRHSLMPSTIATGQLIPNGFTSYNLTDKHSAPNRPAAMPDAADSKQCNPILLHAMLTMLSNEQPHLPTGRAYRNGVADVLYGQPTGQLEPSPMVALERDQARERISRQQARPSGVAHSFSWANEQFRDHLGRDDSAARSTFDTDRDDLNQSDSNSDGCDQQRDEDEMLIEGDRRQFGETTDERQFERDATRLNQRTQKTNDNVDQNMDAVSRRRMLQAKRQSTLIN